ncbi:MAG: MarR family winged helix-turn-helix transcriptional regulator [Methyloligellaceae bacterium]
MTENQSLGLGELLRHLSDLLDKASEAHYHASGLDYRARYTPILRRIGSDPITISDLQKQLHITQGAISQTVKLMENDNLVQRIATEDRRSQTVKLTGKGKRLQRKLDDLWQLRLKVIDDLEKEVGAPLRSILKQVITALENNPFDARLLQKEEAYNVRKNIEKGTR